MTQCLLYERCALLGPVYEKTIGGRTFGNRTTNDFNLRMIKLSWNGQDQLHMLGCHQYQGMPPANRRAMPMRGLRVKVSRLFPPNEGSLAGSEPLARFEPQTHRLQGLQGLQGKGLQSGSATASLLMKNYQFMKEEI